MTFTDFMRQVHEDSPSTLTFREWTGKINPKDWLEYGDRYAMLEREIISDDLSN